METEQKTEVVADDAVGRNAVVHEDELAALKDSRERDMPVFLADRGKSHVGPWVVATSDHQAKLAMVDWVYPMSKLTKRQRDERYTVLLENKITGSPQLAIVPRKYTAAEIDKMLEMARNC